MNEQANTVSSHILKLEEVLKAQGTPIAEAQMITLAALTATHATNDSARLCFDDMAKMMEEGRPHYACNRALESLRHSIGILHPDYVKAKALAEEIELDYDAQCEQSQAYFDLYIAGDR